MKLPSLTFPYNYIVGGLAVLALVATIVFGVVQLKKIDHTNHVETVQTGVVKEREENHQKVITHVEQAHEAVNNPTPVAISVVCEKYDRNCPHGK